MKKGLSQQALFHWGSLPGTFTLASCSGSRLANQSMAILVLSGKCGLWGQRALMG